jgi:hypothetical protein
MYGAADPYASSQWMQLSLAARLLIPAKLPLEHLLERLLAGLTHLVARDSPSLRWTTIEKAEKAKAQKPQGGACMADTNNPILVGIDVHHKTNTVCEYKHCMCNGFTGTRTHTEIHCRQQSSWHT